MTTLLSQAPFCRLLLLCFLVRLRSENSRMRLGHRVNCTCNDNYNSQQPVVSSTCLFINFKGKSCSKRLCFAFECPKHTWLSSKCLTRIPYKVWLDQINEWLGIWSQFKHLFHSKNDADQAMCEKLKKGAFCEESKTCGTACASTPQTHCRAYVQNAQYNRTSHE